MHNPASYVVEADVRELGGDLMQRNVGELRQWRKRDWKRYPSTERLGERPQWVLLSVLALWRGLRGGEDGCGVQIAVRAWARLVGCSTREINYAMARLERLGLIRREYRDVEQRWGLFYKRADICSVTYITDAGMRRLARVSGKSRQLTVFLGHGIKRVLRAFGLVGNLLRTLNEKIRFVARRVSALKNYFRPTALKRDTNGRQNSERERAPGARTAGPARTPTPGRETPRRSASGQHGAGIEGDRTKLFALYQRGELTPAAAWPDWWRWVNEPYRDADGHFQEYQRKAYWWGMRQCEAWVARFDVETNATQSQAERRGPRPPKVIRRQDHWPRRGPGRRRPAAPGR